MVAKALARVTVAEQSLDVHFRVHGTGAPLLLLHPSPLNGAFLQPVMERLEGRCLTIALDTPGFGDSDALPEPPKDLLSYCAVIDALLEHLGLPRVAVYGSATGAQIAIELAKAYPERVSGVILDNAATFTDEEVASIENGYFADVTPAANGAHLASAWQVAHDMLQHFPWHQPSAANRIAPAPKQTESFGPVPVMDATVAGYLTTGPDYHYGYRAAFHNERAERVIPITQPVVIMRWQGSLLKRYTDRFDDYAFGTNVTMADCEVSLDARWTTMESQLEKVFPAATASVDAKDVLARNASSGQRFKYLDTAHGQLRVIEQPDSQDAEPIVGVHPLSLSAHSLAAVLGSRAPKWLFDLPGHGGSTPLAAPTLIQLAESVVALADQLQLTRYQLYGYGTGVLVAQAAAAIDDRINGVAAFNLSGSDVDQAQQALAIQWPPALLPQAGGGHWFEAWHWLRRLWLNQDLAPPDSQWLTGALVDLMKSRPTWQALKEAQQ